MSDDVVRLAGTRAGLPEAEIQALQGKSLWTSVKGMMWRAGVAVADLSGMVQYLSMSRQVQGLGAGTVHLGSEACFPFAGRRKDHYSPVSESGGAIVRVRAREGGPGPGPGLA